MGRCRGCRSRHSAGPQPIPSLRWFRQNAVGFDVAIEDISEACAALALQGPTSARLLREVSTVEIDRLKYFRVASGTIAGVRVDVSRTGYTGDLGYEIWTPSRHALRVWDALMDGGKPFDIKPCGMLALDVARVEAGLLLIDVDFFGSKKATIESQRYSPYEMGLGRLVSLDKNRFIGQRALREEYRRGPARQVVGLEIDWTEVEAIYEKPGPRAWRRRDRVTRRRACLQRRASGGTGDDNNLVAGAEADDCSGDDRSAVLCRGNQAPVRGDCRSRASSCRRHDRQDAVLQSAAEDGHAAGLRFYGSGIARTFRTLEPENPSEPTMFSLRGA